MAQDSVQRSIQSANLDLGMAKRMADPSDDLEPLDERRARLAGACRLRAAREAQSLAEADARRPRSPSRAADTMGEVLCRRLVQEGSAFWPVGLQEHEVEVNIVDTGTNGEVLLKCYKKCCVRAPLHVVPSGSQVELFASNEPWEMSMTSPFASMT